MRRDWLFVFSWRLYQSKRTPKSMREQFMVIEKWRGGGRTTVKSNLPNTAAVSGCPWIKHLICHKPSTRHPSMHVWSNQSNKWKLQRVSLRGKVVLRDKIHNFLGIKHKTDITQLTYAWTLFHQDVFKSLKSYLRRGFSFWYAMFSKSLLTLIDTFSGYKL